MKACFAANTPIRTPDGSRSIEDIRVGDLVLSRDEHTPDGLVVAQRVEEVFERFAAVWEVRLGSRVIRTTGEHPFYRDADGWVAVTELRIGDRLLCEDGSWVVVEGVRETDRWETVYNFRVSEFHTYFVGCDEWEFSVWAHNQYDPVDAANQHTRRAVAARLQDLGMTEHEATLVAAYGASRQTSLEAGAAIRLAAERGDVGILRSLHGSLVDQQSLLIQHTRSGTAVLVGEGDFGLAASLIAQPRHPGSRLVATSYDSRATVVRKYGDAAERNLAALEADGVAVHHGVDARGLHWPGVVGEVGASPQAIIFHFPFSGSRKFNVNQALLGEFLGSARRVLSPDGAVLVTLRDQAPYIQWGLAARASENGFAVTRTQRFSQAELPNYIHRETLSSNSVDVSNGVIHLLRRQGG